MEVWDYEGPLTINSITECLKPGADCSLNVDDFQICYISSNMSIIERHYIHSFFGQTSNSNTGGDQIVVGYI